MIVTHPTSREDRVDQWVREWSRRLHIRDQVRTCRISIWQVTDHKSRPGCSLVGVTLEQGGPCIYHTRQLIEEDIVHELLHVAFPDWSEEIVQPMTTTLLRLHQPNAIGDSWLTERFHHASAG